VTGRPLSKILMLTLHYSDHDCLPPKYIQNPPLLVPPAKIPVTIGPIVKKMYLYRHLCIRSTYPNLSMPYHDGQVEEKVSPHKTSTCRPTPNQTKVECVALWCNLGQHEHRANKTDSGVPWKTWRFVTSNLL
jgi:hypothetical protein